MKRQPANVVYGHCDTCLGPYALTKSGNVRKHNRFDGAVGTYTSGHDWWPVCEGSGQPATGPLREGDRRMKREDWASYKPVTSCLAVGRWGKDWWAIDRETYAQIGYPFPTMHAAMEYARERERTTYCGRMEV